VTHWPIVRLKSPIYYILGEYKQQVMDNKTFVKENIRWQPPAMRWVLLNTNGVTRDNNVPDYGGILCKGLVILCPKQVKNPKLENFHRKEQKFNFEKLNTQLLIPLFLF